MTSKGKMWGLGVGPGDPDLITLKALKIMLAADVVAYPAPLEEESFARSIATPHLSGKQIEYPIRIPMVADRRPAQDVYDNAAKYLGTHLNEGRTVAVLCEGDPFFYGSFMYLFQRLAGKYDVNVVPGVSSVMACAAVAKMPLGERADVITILPASLSKEELKMKIKDTSTSVIMKVGKHLSKVKNVVNELGLIDNAHYVERATLPEQRAMPLAEVAEDTAPYFSMILVQNNGVQL